MNTLKNLIAILKNKKKSLAVAESCSGGYLSYLLTKIPGSSKVFKGSIVVYSLEAKNKFFKIPLPLLKKTQGVSNEIALLLAKRVKKVFNSDIGVSLVGFAGPETKKGIKAGTVYITVANRAGVISKKMVIKGSRDTVRKKASLFAINLLYKVASSK
ncbi:MAG: CinA family protein [Candidatus Omnitrophota bacterium]|nr:CinA family protein [Candidatus Omnitrophota bacterium]